jgi:hypothetical protein
MECSIVTGWLWPGNTGVRRAKGRRLKMLRGHIPGQVVWQATPRC